MAKKSSTQDLVKLIRNQETGPDDLRTLFEQDMEQLAISRMRICIFILILLFPALAMADHYTRGYAHPTQSFYARAILEIILFLILALSFIPQFKRNSYAFMFILSFAVGFQNLWTLLFEGGQAVDQYIIFALIYSIIGILMPWGGQAIAGICFPMYLFYPIGVLVGQIPMTEHFFVKSNIYLISFMFIVIIAATINESLRFNEYILRKHLEGENIVLQGYQTRLKRAYERMENLAIIDPLTRVYNRSYLLQWLSTDIYKNKSATEVFSMIMYDCDHFKEINDIGGHQTGDRVLQRLSEIVQEELDSMAMLFRYGGDEFCVILPGLDLSRAVKTAERIRRRVEMHPDLNVRMPDGLSVQVTISMGVTAEFLISPIDPDFIIRWLDAALMESKRKGKNCIHVFDSVERRIQSSAPWLEPSEP